jgi:RimJ/RimL family protein N-acetyltransferase
MSDLEEIHALHSFPAVDKYNTLGIPKDIQETQSVVHVFDSNHKMSVIKGYTFVMEQLEDAQFVGLIALNLGSEKFMSAEVWFKLHPDYWQSGFGTEALMGILKFGFEELNLHRIEAGCAVENLASARLLEKVGMTREGRKRQVLPLHTGWADNYMYAILRSDWH